MSKNLRTFAVEKEFYYEQTNDFGTGMCRNNGNYEC